MCVGLYTMQSALKFIEMENISVTNFFNFTDQLLKQSSIWPNQKFSLTDEYAVHRILNFICKLYTHYSYNNYCRVVVLVWLPSERQGSFCFLSSDIEQLSSFCLIKNVYWESSINFLLKLLILLQMEVKTRKKLKRFVLKHLFE